MKTKLLIIIGLTFRFSPVVFFIVSSSSDPSLVQVELFTYNEQVFEVRVVPITNNTSVRLQHHREKW